MAYAVRVYVIPEVGACLCCGTNAPYLVDMHGGRLVCVECVTPYGRLLFPGGDVIVVS